jgi:hypothetical protein
MRSINQDEHDRRKPYTKPEIIEELVLETRAGSPLSVPNPIDLLNNGE